MMMGFKFFTIKRPQKQQDLRLIIAKSGRFLQLGDVGLCSSYSTSTTDQVFKLMPQLKSVRFVSDDCDRKIKVIDNNYNSVVPTSRPWLHINKFSSIGHQLPLTNYYWNYLNRGNINLEGIAIATRGITTSSPFQYAQQAGNDADEPLAKGDKILRVKLKATRLDAILKKGLGLSRNKIEKAFYDDRVRINGERPEKKSQTVFEGDEIDIVRGYNELTPDKFIDVSRVEIVELKGDEEEDDESSGSVDDEDTKISAVLRRSKNLTIRNYSPPWKGSSQD